MSETSPGQGSQPAKSGVSRGERIDAHLRKVGEWIGKHTLAAVTLVGLFLYGLALVSYSQFYAAFGLYPDEVGLDYTRALTRTITAFCFWSLSLLAVVLIASPVLILGWLGWRRLTRRWPKSKSVGAWTKLTLVVLGVLLLFFGFAFNTPNQLAERVKRGEELRQPSEHDVIGYYREAIRNPLRIRVERVRVSPADSAAGLPANLDQPRYAYLGRTGDTIILYDTGTVGRTVRVPAALVVLSDLAEDEDTDEGLLWKIISFP